MKICFIGKQPPIQGGVSRTGYWTAVALAERDIEVHLVTNANEVEDQFRIHNFWTDENEPHDNYKSLIFRHDTAATPDYIPHSNPFVTKLATLATDVIRKHNCDLIYAAYYEPYGMAAYLASQWTGVPFGVRHAGSDIGRLMRNPLHTTAYTEMLKAADYILASPSTYRRFIGSGINDHKVYPALPNPLPDETIFTPEAEPLDLNDFRQRTLSQLKKNKYYRPYHTLLEKPFDDSKPTIGIYGKIGTAKGSFDLLIALEQLKQAGEMFNFAVLGQGRPRSINRFLKEIEERGLSDCTWLFPFIPHWKVPSFIRACTAVCFIERGFDLAIHYPSLTREIWACGTALILSREIATQQRFADRIKEGENVLLAEPRNHDELARAVKQAINAPEKMASVGSRGYTDLGQQRYTFAQFRQDCADQFTEIYQDIQERKKGMSVAEMQACLARLYVDEPFRKLFYLEPDETIRNYSLTNEEKDALQSIDKKLLNSFARSLRNKQKRKYLMAYPLLFKLGKPIHRYFERYYQLYPARPGQTALEQILTFGEFMSQTLSAAEDVAPFAHDLVRYEQLYYQAKFQPASTDRLETVNARQSTEEPFGKEDKPSLAEGVFTAVFDYPITDIAEQLRDNNLKPEFGEKETHLVFQQLTNSLKPRIFAVTPATYRVMELCNGRTDIDKLVTTIETELGMSDLEAALLNILHDLQTSGILRHG